MVSATAIVTAPPPLLCTTPWGVNISQSSVEAGRGEAGSHISSWGECIRKILLCSHVNDGRGNLLGRHLVAIRSHLKNESEGVGSVISIGIHHQRHVC